MDQAVLRSMAKWPDVPDVYGWLSLDRRGNWLIRGERIGNAALRDFIGRNYQPDARGSWYFQNGPQRVFVELAYTPLVLHAEGEALFDQCGRPFHPLQAFLDEEGSVLMSGEPGVGLLDDRDLADYADRAQDLPEIKFAAVPGRFGFVRRPAPGSASV
ncbi:MAG: DUF2946 family protein [Candidatus Parcubacteria bacterium]|nr:DUF2946 family protein [Burkholderiales bacterium]